MSSIEFSKQEIDMFLGKFQSPFTSDIIFRSQTFLKQNSYQIESLLGAGQFGAVWKGKNIQNDEEVAIKLIIISDKEQIDNEFEEVQFIKMVESEWVVKYVDQLVDNQNKCLFIITEFCSKGDLHKFYLENQNISRKQIIDIFCGILKGIMAIHAHNIILKDLNPHNILLSDELTPKICYIGLNNLTTSKMSNLSDGRATHQYMSKEQSEGKPQFESDYYSVGAIICFLCGLEIEEDPLISMNLKMGIFPQIQGLEHEELLLIAFSMMNTDPKLRQSPQKILDKLSIVQLSEYSQIFGIEDVSFRQNLTLLY